MHDHRSRMGPRGCCRTAMIVGNIAVALASLTPARSSAQIVAPATAPMFVARDTSDSASSVSRPPLPTSRQAAALAGVAVGTTALAAVFDRRIDAAFRQNSVQDNGALRQIFGAARVIGGPIAVATGPIVYLAGRATGQYDLTATGLAITEAVLTAGITTTAIKVVVGRARPYVSEGRPGVFHPFRLSSEGASGSFPSGHASSAFAVATVLSEQAALAGGRRAAVVPPVAYGVATLVAVSRVYHDAHWASDVVAGSAIGIASGLLVVRRATYDRPSGLERWLLATRIAPTSHNGAALTWSFSTR